MIFTVSLSRPATWVCIASEVPGPVAVLVDTGAPGPDTDVVPGHVAGELDLLLPEGVVGTQLRVIKADWAI